ncbi:MAG: hypothetical protein CFE32_21060, partial [Alphaproteobacteria bacterium PA3]
QHVVDQPLRAVQRLRDGFAHGAAERQVPSPSGQPPQEPPKVRYWRSPTFACQIRAAAPSQEQASLVSQSALPGVEPGSGWWLQWKLRLLLLLVAERDL